MTLMWKWMLAFHLIQQTWLNSNSMIIRWRLKADIFFTWIRNPRWPPRQDLVLNNVPYWYGKMNNSFSFFLGTTWLNTNYTWIAYDHWMAPYKVCIFFHRDWKSRTTTTFTIRPYGKMNKSFFLETTNI